VLTPLVTGVSYDYYNASTNSWQNYPMPQRGGKGQWQLPTGCACGLPTRR